MHPKFLLLLPLVACTALAAQPAPAPAPAPLVAEQATPDGRKNQKVELIRVEDDAVVIDEVRYAGQTESIKVQPKGRAPAYEIQPTGRRVWNVFSF
ncbi:hypothetical protein [Ramlibacter sp. WS9]|uniref:hypothetical protein n=1 Tax=Ramlibacter sp. WS9 TaxID=1882741 RepID=UPI001144CC6F|nr:hypothetical protein [Ramlibacter sp. WS9]ROZ76644.1 hypothetical protein EEB15_12425 [Ramlibacter sp. WS9]